MRLVFVGLKDDLILLHLAKFLPGHELLWVDPRELESGAPLTWDMEGTLLEGDDLSQVDGIVVRRLPAERWAPQPDTTVSAEEVMRHSTEAMERAQQVEAWLWDCEQSGVPLVNSCESRPYDHKPMQLSMLHRAGIPLPRTLVTNYPVAARAFAEDVGQVIFKPVAGGRETEVLEDLDRLEVLGSAPVIFQERIIGPDVRVTVVGGQVVSQVEILSHPVDYRLGEAYRAGQQTYVPIELPPEVQALAVKTAALCHHSLSGVDLKRAADGRYVVLEANSAPVYLDIELKTGHPISARLAALLTQPRP